MFVPGKDSKTIYGQVKADKEAKRVAFEVFRFCLGLKSEISSKRTKAILSCSSNLIIRLWCSRKFLAHSRLLWACWETYDWPLVWRKAVERMFIHKIIYLCLQHKLEEKFWKMRKTPGPNEIKSPLETHVQLVWNRGDNVWSFIIWI